MCEWDVKTYHLCGNFTPTPTLYS